MEGRYRPFTYFTDYKFTREAYTALFDIPVSSSERVFLDFPNTAYYSALNYIPYALPFYVARKLHLSMGFAYYTGKLLVFLIFFFGMRYSIRIIPFLKWSLCLIALLPMQLYVLSSISGDPITNVFASMSIAILLRAIYVDETLSNKTLLTLFALAMALSLGKVIYVVLFLPLLLVPVSKFGNLKRKLGILSFFALPVLGSALLWSHEVQKNYISFDTYNVNYRVNSALNPNADFTSQQDFFKEHPDSVILLLNNTLKEKSEFYLRSFVGGLGAFIDVLQSTSDSYLALAALLLLSFSGNGIRLPFFHKLFFVGITLLLFSATLLSQFLLWTPLGSTVIEGVQGRYFLPFFILVLLLFSRPTKINAAFCCSLLIALVVFINYKALSSTYTRYYVENYLRTYTYQNGFEEATRPLDSLQLSDASISSSTSHSGQRSLYLAPGKKITLIKQLPSVLFGDISTVTMWIKGSGAVLGFTGSGTDCGTIQIGHAEPGFMAQDGWTRLLMHYSMFYKCKENSLDFTIENKSNAALFVDDISIDIKRKPN